MHETNVKKVLDLLGPSDIVLDIGGWARPFNRANYVLDAEPYETRGFYGASRPAQGGKVEHFTRETWIQRDICNRDPFPFADKEINFVVCSHTLEDIRDPLWVCSEMVRIGRAGYIEVPSRLAESCRGIERGQVGWSHHRWLVDVTNGSLRFLMKYHMIHSHWRFSFPRHFWHSVPEECKVSWLFWQDSFQYSEVTLHGIETIAAELEQFVRRSRPYPEWLMRADASVRGAATLNDRIIGKIKRTLKHSFYPRTA
jgi:hypothetical protein